MSEEADGAEIVIRERHMPAIVRIGMLIDTLSGSAIAEQNIMMPHREQRRAE